MLTKCEVQLFSYSCQLISYLMHFLSMQFVDLASLTFSLLNTRILGKILSNFNNRQRYIYNGRLIGNHIWPIKWQQRQ